jgi:hypothetical protein
MAEERNVPDEPREVEEHRDDLELPDETAEEVKGGALRPQKVKPDKQ